MESKSKHTPCQPEKHDYRIKISILGDYQVGKTSIQKHYFFDNFEASPKGGGGINIKTVNYEDKVIKLLVYDLVRQERFSRPDKELYRGTHGVLVVYDVTNPSSFESVTWYIDEIKQKAPPDCQIFLLGNKIDKEEARTVSYAAGSELASNLGIPLFETSARSGVGVKEAFIELIGLMMTKAMEEKFEENKTQLSFKDSQTQSKCF